MPSQSMKCIQLIDSIQRPESSEYIARPMKIETKARLLNKRLREDQMNKDFYHRPDYVYQSDRRHIMVQ